MISNLNKTQLKKLDDTIIKIIENNQEPYILSSMLFDKVCDSNELYADTPMSIIFKRFQTLVEHDLIGCYGTWQYEELSYYKKSC